MSSKRRRNKKADEDFYNDSDLEDIFDEPKKTTVRKNFAAKSSSKSKPKSKPTSKRKPPVGGKKKRGPAEVSQKVLKAAARSKWGKGSISTDAARILVCKAKEYKLSRAQAIQVLKRAHSAVVKRKAKRIQTKDIKYGLKKTE